MAIYLSRKKGGTVATPITPSNSSPAQMTADTPVNPTANGYAIESYTEVVPSNASPATLSKDSIYKIKTNGGKAVASITDITPSSTPTSVSANDVVKIGGNGVIVDSMPTITNILPNNSPPVSLSTSGNYHPTTSGYAISHYTEIDPTYNEANLTIGGIYRANTPGKAIKGYLSKTPSDSSPASVSSGAIIKASASGYLYASSGLKKFKSGTVTRGTSAVTVNCGFEPKIVCCFKTSTSTGSAATGDAFLLYDSEWSTANVVSAYKSSSSANFQKYAKDSYITTSSTGFTLGGTTSVYTGSYTYFAIG